MAFGHFAPWIDRSKSVRSNTHMDYFSLIFSSSAKPNMVNRGGECCLCRANLLLAGPN